MNIEVDLSQRFREVGEQGDRLTCLAFATTSAHEYYQELSQSLCIEWLYYYAAIIGGELPGPGKIGSGTRVSEVSLVLEQLGQPFEQVWPYRTDPNLQTWDPPQNPKPRYYASCAIGPFSLDKIKKNLDNAQPAVITCWAEDEFQTPDKKGEIAIVDIKLPSSYLAMHAILVVGYGTLNQKVYLKVRNSWGKNWGIRGYAWVSEDYLTAYADECLHFTTNG